MVAKKNRGTAKVIASAATPRLFSPGVNACSRAMEITEAVYVRIVNARNKAPMRKEKDLNRVRANVRIIGLHSQLSQAPATHCTRKSPLPLLPSGPGGVGESTLRETDA